MVYFRFNLAKYGPICEKIYPKKQETKNLQSAGKNPVLWCSTSSIETQVQKFTKKSNNSTKPTECDNKTPTKH